MSVCTWFFTVSWSECRSAVSQRGLYCWITKTGSSTTI